MISKKISLGCFGFVFFFNSALQANALKQTLQSEYKKDHLYYDDRINTFYRNRYELSLGQNKNFNLTHIYLAEEKKNNFTWSFKWGGKVDPFNLYLGHFMVNFGTGLILGPKKFSSPDPFKSKLTPSTNKPFRVNKSGQPIYSFQGIAVRLKKSISSFSFFLNSFGSIRERYSKEDSLTLSSSLSSLNNHADKEKNYNYLVKINDYGLMLEGRYKDFFKAQTYGLFTFLTNGSGQKIIWDFQTDPFLTRGIKNFLGYGFLGEYRDQNLGLFCDYSQIIKKIISTEQKTKIDSSAGFIFGLNFKHSRIGLSLTLKKTDRNFYPLYGADTNCPEKGFESKISFRLLKNLTIGGGALNQEKLAPSSNEKDLKSLTKETLFIDYKKNYFKKLNLKIENLKINEGGDATHRLKLKTTMKLNLNKMIENRFFSLLQTEKEKNLSFSLGGGLSFLYFSFLKFSFDYAKIKISKQNRLYLNLAPSQNSISSGFFIKNSSHLLVGQLLFKDQPLSFRGRYLYHFSSHQTYKSRLEFSAKITF